MKALKLWLISQTENSGYDTYDRAVVCAETEEYAKHIHPSGNPNDWGNGWKAWADSPEGVTAVEIGMAAPGVLPGVVVASFNAG